MVNKKKPKYAPTPDPRNFNAPDTRGWHALADHGWTPLQPSATLELPPSKGNYQFKGTIGVWDYEFELTDGQGIQKNVTTKKTRDVKWFESPLATTNSSSSNPRSYYPSPTTNSSSSNPHSEGGLGRDIRATESMRTRNSGTGVQKIGSWNGPFSLEASFGNHPFTDTIAGGPPSATTETSSSNAHSERRLRQDILATVCPHHAPTDREGQPWPPIDTWDTQITWGHNQVTAVDKLESILQGMEDTLFANDLRGFDQARAALINRFGQDQYIVAWMKTHTKYCGLSVICKGCRCTMKLSWERDTPAETRAKEREQFLRWNRVSVPDGKPMV